MIDSLISTENSGNRALKGEASMLFGLFGCVVGSWSLTRVMVTVRA
jgi:hypothetical protein